MFDDIVEFSELKGKIITELKVSKEEIFHCKTGEVYKMYHRQDCCENVQIEDICGGDIEDIMFTPVLIAEVSTNKDNSKEHYESFTWTFYKLGTIKGYVDIRWYGESNGYYSEEVDFVKIEE